eukprot:8776006-Pyramimonas_sp.AAC.1
MRSPVGPLGGAAGTIASEAASRGCARWRTSGSIPKDHKVPDRGHPCGTPRENSKTRTRCEPTSECPTDPLDRASSALR